MGDAARGGSAAPGGSAPASAGVLAALCAAVLFGASIPFAKRLLGQTPPLLLAGLLYLGSGVGLSLLYALRRGRTAESPLTRADLPWLSGAVFSGGVVAPGLLMLGLRSTPASTASLLSNLEGVFTALLAWFVFRENFDRRIALGMVLIVAGGIILSWQPAGALSVPVPALLIIAASLCWGIDNNLTQKVSAGDPLQVAAVKGVAAGGTNLVLALASGSRLPGPAGLANALLIGLMGYGLSLALFVIALRYIGTARTGAYFSVAPFVGAAVAVPLLHEAIGARFVMAAALMAAGIWLHLTERHAHEHEHAYLEHSHRHVHDEHHQHIHREPEGGQGAHAHPHVHLPMTHVGPHYPDIHHRHEHT